MIDQIKSDLRQSATPERAMNSAWFFKTGPGQYGEGDKFLGISVPDQRKIAKKYKNLSTNDISKLLASPWHEERLTAIFILVLQFKAADNTKQKEIYEFYLQQTSRINNWDLVDSSASYIVGAYIFKHQELIPILFDLAKSPQLWERRIAIIASGYFLTQGEPGTTIKLSETLLKDKEDLMHKAVGWTLREMGKRCDRQLLIDFLNKHAHAMPRTMLRYSIEHFDENSRKKYLAMKSS
jgi:3-methyladenine DNA glycosylase AlkD